MTDRQTNKWTEFPLVDSTPVRGRVKITKFWISWPQVFFHFSSFLLKPFVTPKPPPQPPPSSSQPHHCQKHRIYHHQSSKECKIDYSTLQQSWPKVSRRSFPNWINSYCISHLIQQLISLSISIITFEFSQFKSNSNRGQTFPPCGNGTKRWSW